MTKFWLEFDQNFFTMKNVNNWTWLKNLQQRTLTIDDYIILVPFWPHPFPTTPFVHFIISLASMGYQADMWNVNIHMEQSYNKHQNCKAITLCKKQIQKILHDTSNLASIKWQANLLLEKFALKLSWSI